MKLASQHHYSESQAFDVFPNGFQHTAQPNPALAHVCSEGPTLLPFVGIFLYQIQAITEDLLQECATLEESIGHV